MHGCGNDFVIIDNRVEKLNLLPNQIIELADYKESIGFDQLLLIEDSDVADVAIRIFNNDGSEVNACGNGSRCVAELILDKPVVTIATKERILNAHRQNDLISINMGKAQIIQENMHFGELEGMFIDLGNPHVVINIAKGGWTKGNKLDNIDIAKFGAMIENDPCFPNKTNVNFVQVVNSSLVHLRTWERGAGATKACGSGACASFYALHKQGLIECWKLRNGG